MKRVLLGGLALLTMASPLTVGEAAARDRGGETWQDRRGDDGRRDNDGWRDGRRGDEGWRDGRGDDRRGGRDWRDDRRGGRHDRWERGRHNGYMYQGRWQYGPPPAAFYGRPGFYADYRQWNRGDYLPRYYRDRFVVVDYHRHDLRPPPRGYHYVRDDRGDILLAAIATGLIVSVILNN